MAILIRLRCKPIYTNNGSPCFLFKKKITRKNAKLTFLKFVKDKTIQPNIPLPIYIFKFEAFSFSLSFSKFSNVSHHIHIIVKRHSMTKTFLRYTQVLVISNKLKNLPETNTNTYGINSKHPHKSQEQLVRTNLYFNSTSHLRKEG
jgi:hypothetical protein